MKKFFSLTKRFIQETDNLLLILITATSIFGVLMVYTTTRCRLEDGQTIARDATVMIIAAALVEAVALFANVVCLLVILMK